MDRRIAIQFGQREVVIPWTASELGSALVLDGDIRRWIESMMLTPEEKEIMSAALDRLSERSDLRGLGAVSRKLVRRAAPAAQALAARRRQIAAERKRLQQERMRWEKAKTPVLPVPMPVPAPPPTPPIPQSEPLFPSHVPGPESVTEAQKPVPPGPPEAAAVPPVIPSIIPPMVQASAAPALQPIVLPMIAPPLFPAFQQTPADPYQMPPVQAPPFQVPPPAAGIPAGAQAPVPPGINPIQTTPMAPVAPPALPQIPPQLPPSLPAVPRGNYIPQELPDFPEEAYFDDEDYDYLGSAVPGTAAAGSTPVPVKVELRPAGEGSGLLVLLAGAAAAVFFLWRKGAA